MAVQAGRRIETGRFRSNQSLEYSVAAICRLFDLGKICSPPS